MRAGQLADSPAHPAPDNCPPAHCSSRRSAYFLIGSMLRKSLAVAAALAATLTTIPAAGASQAHAAPAPRNPVDNDHYVSGPTVTVDKDASWSFASASVGTSATPPPPPPVVQAPPSRVDAPATASRSSSRAPVKALSTSAPATATGAAVIAEARKHVGTPYVHGGRSPGAFDCSGFTSYVFAKFGVSLSPSSAAQRHQGRVVSAAEARPGDLVWWPGHVGIYTGNGNHIAARNPSTPLYESKIFRGGPTYIRVLSD